MSRVDIFKNRITLILFIALLVTTFYLITMFKTSDSKIELKLHFIPERYGSCEELFRNTPAADFAMSPTFNTMNGTFHDEIAKNTGEDIEGYSAQLHEEYLALHYIASQSNIVNICETGFNFGHSSLNYLTANDQTIVHSFDLGNHRYAHAMSEFIKKMFPTRFFIHFGNSVDTIPKFIEENPTFRCDLMLVDGGHFYEVALADLQNFAKIANLNGNFIVFDDYPTDWGQSIGMAWEVMRQSEIIAELMRCSFKSPGDIARGFVIGKVTKRPHGGDAEKQPSSV